MFALRRVCSMLFFGQFTGKIAVAIGIALAILISVGIFTYRKIGRASCRERV